MKIDKKTLGISLFIGLLVAVVSLAGLVSEGVYIKETLSWVAQGTGQDLVNLVLVCPLFVLASFKLYKRESRFWFAVWFGLVIYLVYSYLMYSFFMHFGSWFLIYVAILGLSFHLFVRTLLGLRKEKISSDLVGRKSKVVGGYLVLNGLLFGFLWLSNILKSLIGGQELEGIREIGFWTNPVYVLDLAFILPGMILVGILVWKNDNWGRVFAGPLLVFVGVMGMAIVSMIVNMFCQGVSDTMMVVVFMMVNVLLASYFLSLIFNKSR